MRLVTKFKNKSFFERKITRAIITMHKVADVWTAAAVNKIELYGIFTGVEGQCEVVSSKTNGVLAVGLPDESNK